MRIWKVGGLLNMEINKDLFSFYELDWDTAYFGLSCAKAVLHGPVTLECWSGLKEKFMDYQFVSIENRNCEPSNAQLIGRYSDAFLADVNIQFIKKLDGKSGMPDHITVARALERNDAVTDISDFEFSKFIEDPELLKRGGSRVYYEWLSNSFGRPDKHFILFGNCGKIDGYILHAYSGKSCAIELIAVSKNAYRSGIGTKMFKALDIRHIETAAPKSGSGHRCAIRAR
jgi:hypothetical protein